MHSALASIQKSYAEMLGSLDVARMQLHPAGDPEQWSAQQLVEHLVLTFRSTDEVLEERNCFAAEQPMNEVVNDLATDLLGSHASRTTIPVSRPNSS